MALNHEKIVVLFDLQYHLKENKYFSGITYTKRRFNYKVFVMAKERKPIRVRDNRNFNYTIISEEQFWNEYVLLTVYQNIKAGIYQEERKISVTKIVAKDWVHLNLDPSKINTPLTLLLPASDW